MKKRIRIWTLTLLAAAALGGAWWYIQASATQGQSEVNMEQTLSVLP